MNNQVRVLWNFSLIFIIFFSCEDNSKILNEINLESQEPVGIANQIKMIYTDSTKIKAILTAPKHLDYTNLTFKYSTFPEGLKVDFFDDKNMYNHSPPPSRPPNRFDRWTFFSTTQPRRFFSLVI